LEILAFLYANQKSKLNKEIYVCMYEIASSLVIGILVTIIVIEIVLMTKTWRRKRPGPWSFV